MKIKEQATGICRQTLSQDLANTGIQQGRKVSVIIPTRNNTRKIEHNIQSLLSGRICPDEIIVSDQSDNDETRKVTSRVISELDADRIKYIRQSRTGLSANRNDALRHASGDFIVFVDDDVIVSKDCIALMLAEWSEVWNYKPVLITGRILPAPEFSEGDLVTALRQVDSRMVFDGKPSMHGVLIGAYFGGSKKLFELAGPSPFDEKLGLGARYPAAEDDEFAYNLQKKGLPVVYEPGIVVTHHTKRVSGWRRMRYTRSIGSGGAIAKHFLLGDYKIIFELARQFLVNLKKAVHALVRFNEPEGTSRLLASAGLLYGFTRWTIEDIFNRASRR